MEKRLKSDPMLMKKNVIYKLLYRATKDGNSPESFHQKCDNIKGTLTIIKTTKGMRLEDILNVLGILIVEIQ